MIPKNNTLNRLLAVALLIMLFQTGCATTTVKETTLAPTEEVETASSLSAIEPGTGLAEITDSNQIPAFKDDYGRIELLYTIDKSRKYFEKVDSYPDAFKSIGFTPEKQVETLKLFRDGYVSSKSPQELTAFIAKNFRVFQVTGKENGGEVRLTGYGFAGSDKDVTHSTSLAYDLNFKFSAYLGSLGLHLTPMRSIATDDRVFPPGGLAFVVIEEATNLNENGQAGKSFFTLTHDSRSTTKTTDRAEIFFGIGEDAVQKAKNFNTNGKVYYLLKR
jgi:membrane-bound lytic murein transglycosylase